MSTRRVIVAITGGIAAYKAASLVRELRRRDCAVRVVMTAGAQAFISPLSLQALSGERVHCDLLDEQAEAGMGHIELARWADDLIIAPATAHCLAQLAHGLAPDLLATLWLATTARKHLAPAMNQQMWAHPTVRSNLDRILAMEAVNVIGPESGNQACGDIGAGRMSEPETIAAAICGTDSPAASPWRGRRVVVTAGPTREPIDPVRYLSNRSSGKMGYAVASALAEAGAKVTLVSGPTALPAPFGVQRIDVETAREMLAAVSEHGRGADAFFAVAAVADYYIAEPGERKLKKQDGAPRIELIENPDILATVAGWPSRERPFCVGFAAETNDIEAHARAKLQSKNLDLIAANQVGGQDCAFDTDDNALLLISAAGQQALSRADKRSLAGRLIEHVAKEAFIDE